MAWKWTYTHTHTRAAARALRRVTRQQREFDECVSKLKPFLKTCGYIIKKEVRFIPISGLTGANVLKEVDSKACSWWDSCSKEGHPISSEKTLLEMLDKLQIEGRDAQRPSQDTAARQVPRPGLYDDG